MCSGTTYGWGLLQLPCHICQILWLFCGIADFLLCQMSMPMTCGWLASISPDGPEVFTLACMLPRNTFGQWKVNHCVKGSCKCQYLSSMPLPLASNMSERYRTCWWIWTQLRACNSPGEKGCKVMNAIKKLFCSCGGVSTGERTRIWIWSNQHHSVNLVVEVTLPREVCPPTPGLWNAYSPIGWH